jgi:hypothetical protein
MTGENAVNVSDLQIGLKDILPAELVGKLDGLIALSKIAIYILLAYIIFLIIKQFYGWRRNKRINRIYYKIDEVDRKLDLLLKKHHKINKREIDKIKIKRKGFFSWLFGKKNKVKKKKGK